MPGLPFLGGKANHQPRDLSGTSQALNGRLVRLETKRFSAVRPFSPSRSRMSSGLIGHWSITPLRLKVFLAPASRAFAGHTR